MDRAARAVRRSGVKLLSLGAGHTDLNLLIMELADLQKTAKQLLKVQNSVASTQSKWALVESSQAIRDVSSQVEQLSRLWSEAQRDFVDRVRELRASFESILELERGLDQARHSLAFLEQRETRLRKELKKAAEKKRVNSDEIRQLETRLLQLEALRHNAQMELTDKQMHTESQKLTHFKQGMLRVSDAYLDLATKMVTVFEAQKAVVRQLPDTTADTVDSVKYTGRGVTKQLVEQARYRLSNYQRLQEMRNLQLQQFEARAGPDSKGWEPPPSLAEITTGTTMATIDRLIEGGVDMAPSLLVSRNQSPPPPYTPHSEHLHRHWRRSTCSGETGWRASRRCHANQHSWEELSEPESWEQLHQRRRTLFPPSDSSAASGPSRSLSRCYSSREPTIQHLRISDQRHYDHWHDNSGDESDGELTEMGARSRNP